MASKSHTVRTTRRRLRAIDPTGIGTVRIDPATLDEHLPALALLLEARDPAAADDPQIVRVLASGVTRSGIEVGVRHIDDIDESAIDALVGFCAPDDWLAIGIITGGTARHLDGAPVHHDHAGVQPARVHLVHLQTRQGTVASVLRVAGGEPELISGDDGRPVGRVDDVCRRAFGLPTPPAPPVIELWALQWLGAIVEADVAPTTWHELAAMHPAVVGIDEADLGRDDPAAHLVALGRRLGDVLDWPALRVACGARPWPWCDVPPAVARWLDDGAFGRWVLMEYPPVDLLADAAAASLSPALARRLRATLDAWGIRSSRGSGQ